MATAEWIESADVAGKRKAPKGDGFVDRKAQHILGGAEAPMPEWQTAAAARYLARDAEDLADALSLTLPAWQSPADAVVTAAVRDGADGVRAWADNATRSRITAARRGLAERRAQREGR